MSRINDDGNAFLGTGEAHVDVSQLRDRGLRGHCIRQGEIANIVRYSCEGRGTPRESN